MKISEIITLPSRDESMDKFTFPGIKTTPIKDAFKDFEFAEIITGDDHKLMLYHDGDVISGLHLEIRDGYWQITYSQTLADYRGQGCFRYLLIIAVNRHKTILSDSRQTSESASAWKSLIKHSGGQFNIFVFDGENRIPANTVPENDIWNGKDIPVLMITNTLTGTNVVVSPGREKHMESKGNFSRMEKYLWFGVDSSTENYLNP